MYQKQIEKLRAALLLAGADVEPNVSTMGTGLSDKDRRITAYSLHAHIPNGELHSCGQYVTLTVKLPEPVTRDQFLREG